MAANWFLVVDGKRYGPFTAQQIKSMVNRGEIQPDTLAWRPGQKLLIAADLVPVASLVGHATRFMKRPAYAAAWLLLASHLLSLLFFASGNMLHHEWYLLPQWWISLLITTAFLVAAVWCFEVDFAHSRLWLMPLLAALYGGVTAVCFPLVMHAIARGEAARIPEIAGNIGGKIIVVLWAAVVTQWIAKLYGTRRLITFINGACTFAMIAAGIVLMTKYVGDYHRVSVRTTIEFCFFVAFAAICLVGARVSRRSQIVNLVT